MDRGIFFLVEGCAIKSASLNSKFSVRRLIPVYLGTLCIYCVRFNFHSVYIPRISAFSSFRDIRGQPCFAIAQEPDLSFVDGFLSANATNA